MPDCREAPACKLGSLGCKYVQMSGNTAHNIEMIDDRYSLVDDVPVLGPGQYDLVIVGDMPTAFDDQIGSPFQGDVGDMILNYIDEAGIDRRRVWMTTIVKCKPPRGRRPGVKEVNECRQKVSEEINLIRPKVVMTVGTQSLRLFNLHNAGGVNRIRGNVYNLKLPAIEDSPEFVVVPSINPGTFIYKDKDSLKLRVASDYVLAKRLIDGGSASKHYIPDWRIIDSEEKLDEMIAEIRESKFFAFDTESAHLKYRVAPVLCFSFAWGYPGKTAVLPWFDHDPEAPEGLEYHVKSGWGALNKEMVLPKLRELFADPDITKAAHNFKYDMNVLKWHFGIEIDGFLLDTMVAHHILDEHPPHELEFLINVEFAYGEYSETLHEITGKGKTLRNTYDKVPTPILWPYAATDAEGCYRLALLFFGQLKSKPHLLKLFYDESEPLVKALAESEWHGTFIDRQAHSEFDKVLTLEIEELLKELQEITWPEFKPLSPVQVVKAFTDLGFKDLIEDKNAPSGYRTDKKTLNEIKDTVPLADKILEYRTKRKLSSTYLANILTDMDSDGRIRHSFKLHGTITGRLSCTLFHQIPKIKSKKALKDPSTQLYLPYTARRVQMRDLFSVQPGFSYVYGDFSQVELRILAIVAQDQEMLKILREGGDLHAATAWEFLAPMWPAGLTLLEKDISEFNRTEVGKRVNFGLAYGSEGYALVKTGKWQDWDGVERNFTFEMLEVGMEKWKSRFEGVRDWLIHTPDKARANKGIAVNLFGRERRFGSQLNVEDDYTRGAAERECVNFDIQSAAGSLTNRTIIEIYKEICAAVEWGVVGKEGDTLSEGDIYLINTVHDSIAYECKDSFVPWLLGTIKKVAQRPIAELGGDSFKIDVGVGQSWTEAEALAA